MEESRREVTFSENDVLRIMNRISNQLLSYQNMSREDLEWLMEYVEATMKYACNKPMTLQEIMTHAIDRSIQPIYYGAAESGPSVVIKDLDTYMFGRISGMLERGSFYKHADVLTVKDDEKENKDA